MRLRNITPVPKCKPSRNGGSMIYQQPNKLGGNRHDHIPVVLQQERPGYLSTSIALLLAKLIQRARYYME
jgi:hypothetical protein